MRLWRIVASLGGCLTLGCGYLLDADRYQVGELENPCGEHEVPTAMGCEAVGVTTCGDGFFVPATADGAGEAAPSGCAPIQPSSLCPEGMFTWPGTGDCELIGLPACDPVIFARWEGRSGRLSM